MSVPQPNPQPQQSQAASAPPSGDRPNIFRGAIWVAIGSLIAAAIVCVVWVLVGPENDIIGRAFLTILLLAGFAGVAILDTNLSDRRPPWFVLTSMVVWVAILLIGAFLIWMPTNDRYYFDSFGGVARFTSFVLIVAVLQLALLHIRLYLKAFARHATGFTRAITVVTVILVAVLAVMLVLPLTLHEFVDFGDLYWRFVVAITILAAVGTALVPLINALLAPRKPRAAAPTPAGYAPAPWPTYADGVTPLPQLPDGSPDWNAYYTGYPTYPQGAQAWPQHPQQPALPHQPAPAQHASSEPQPQASPAPYPGAAPHPGAPAPQHPAPPQPAPPQPGYEGYPPSPPPPR